jgi:hypothetical protein
MQTSQISERVPFAEFCRQKSLSKILEAGFRQHVEQTKGIAGFNHATVSDWEDLYRSFLTVDRRRKHAF